MILADFSNGDPSPVISPVSGLLSEAIKITLAKKRNVNKDGH